MSQINIEILQGKTQFKPGQECVGKVTWQLDRQPRNIELRLFWYTKGKGTQDIEIVKTIPIEPPSDRGQYDFRFNLPKGPYSFSGKLISLIWALEFVAEPSGETGRVELTLSSTGSEILI